MGNQQYTRYLPIRSCLECYKCKVNYWNLNDYCIEHNRYMENIYKIPEWCTLKRIEQPE